MRRDSARAALVVPTAFVAPTLPALPTPRAAVAARAASSSAAVVGGECAILAIACLRGTLPFMSALTISSSTSML
jgi:hypothetical protein